MKKITKFISHHPRLVLLIMTLLLIPSWFGYKNTGVNYDILSYLPTDLESTQGQEILDKDFKNAATGMLLLKGDDYDADKLKNEILKVDGVEDVISKSSIVGDSIPNEFLPDEIKDIFYSEDCTLLMVKFKESSSSFRTMKAIENIKKIESKEKFLSGMSSLVKDTKDLIDHETPIYVALAVALALIILSLTNESTIIPFLFILNIGYAILYNFGTNLFLGEISYITKAIAAVLQLAVTTDYSIFLYHRYVEEKKTNDDKNDAMDIAIQKTVSSIFASSLTTFAGFIVLILMRLGLGKDIGLVMSKGVLLGLISTVVVLPPMILIVEKIVARFNHRIFLPSFDKTSNFVLGHKNGLFIAFLILFIPAIYGARKARLMILDKIKECIPAPREEVSKYAPKTSTLQIDPEKIRDVIGAGGKVINKIIADTGVKIDIKEDGLVYVSSAESEGVKEAVKIIEGLTKEVKAGEIYLGKVTKIAQFGAFVEVLPNKEGLVHISKLDNKRVEKVEDVVSVGDEILVKVTEIDSQGRINLSRKDAIKEAEEENKQQ